MNFKIKAIPNDLQELLKYFGRATIFTFLNALLLPVVIDSANKLDLYLNDNDLFVETSEFPLSFI